MPPRENKTAKMIIFKYLTSVSLSYPGIDTDRADSHLSLKRAAALLCCRTRTHKCTVRSGGI